MDDTLLNGRAAARDRAWADAYTLLTSADAASPLGAADLEQMAFAAYMIGREDDMVAFLERAHHLHLDAGDALAAARAGIWLGIDLALRGERGPASGWFSRAQRLVERHGEPCAEAGYLLLPVMLGQAMAGDHESALATASAAVEIGEQFTEPDLIALAMHEQGRALVRLGRIDEGLRLLDEAMVAVTADGLTPMVTGIIYCSVIEGCYEVQELRRAHSWTEALSDWCGGQPDLVPFTGQCLTHRAELMQLRGDWEQALVEAQRAAERFFDGMNQLPAAQAHYRQGELHRLKGEYDAAEQAYRAASTWGWSPQPGLALLRMAQGETQAARTALDTALRAAHEPVDRARFLPALIEVSLEMDDLESASEASAELDEIAVTYGMTMISAVARMFRGAVLLAHGAPQDALEPLSQAREAWLELDAPYENARVRALIGQAYQELGDRVSAALEIEAARSVFERLGAHPDIERLTQGGERSDGSALTPREIEVLRLVATGKTNKTIAEELFVSDRTIDRHLSNIFTKLGVSTRTAAAAYAFEQRLL